MIKAEILKDSVSPTGRRLTTFLLTYPRFIHSELMTHRAFSRNAASSRAIPFSRMVEMVDGNTAMPVKWGSKQAGMQSGNEVKEIETAEEIWHDAMFDAVRQATRLDTLGVHKSISNRLLEPFAHMTTIVSATEYKNFFALRAHPDAQPEFQELAYQMLELYITNDPQELSIGEWHLPFITQEIAMSGLPVDALVKMCVARCARVSYVNFKDTTPAQDIELHDRLAASGHWSPFEHAATPSVGLSSNFNGWMQYRKQFAEENHPRADLLEIHSKGSRRA